MSKRHLYIVIVALGMGIAFSLESQAACNASVTATAPNSRYTDNGDGTVVDTQTGLIWKQCSEGQSSSSTACDTGTVANFTWQQALQQAESLNGGGGFAGFTDWRLPNRNELASLVERKCYYPAINESLFPNTPLTAYYWSSSPDIRTISNSSNQAWYVGFSNGLVFIDFKSATLSVRLVRAGL